MNKGEPNEEAKLFQGLDRPLKLEEVLVKPNADSIEDILKIINAGSSPSAAASLVGRLIEPGTIGILEVNGKIEAIGPGRYIFPNPRSNFINAYDLSGDKIQYETLSIIRVRRGFYGLAFDNVQPIILGEGLHVYNVRLFTFKEFVDVNQQYLSHGSIHIMRVPQGHYGAILEVGVPKLLPEGLHVANSNVFTWKQVHNTNQNYINHGTIHILRVPKGQVALVTDNNKPKLIGEGNHYINSNTFNFTSFKDLNQQVIRHGTITRFRVLKGEIGLAWDNNQPTFFDEGIYEKDSPNFIFEKCVDAGEKQIALGSKKIITVWDGEVGVSFKKGKLVVLKPDRHNIDSVEHIFQGFLSTQQQCLHLVHTDGGGPLLKNKDPSMLYCETKDFVEIGLKADVFYKIVDAEKVLLVVGKDSVVPLVRETAIATLNAIIRSTSLSDVAQNKDPIAKSEKDAMKNLPEGAPSAPMFFDKVHDEFISKLHDSFMEKFGIEITNIRIETFKISNKELAENISKQALTTAQTENQLANLAGQTEIATAQQKRDADVARIKAEGESIRLKTETDARNRSTMETAKAEADATVIRARAEASAVEVRAQAEANAILLRANAESKRAELLQKSSLGGQLALFQLYSEMVTDSMSGVNKVLFLPTEAINNPFSFFSMVNGNIPGANLFKPDRKGQN